MPNKLGEDDESSIEMTKGVNKASKVKTAPAVARFHQQISRRIDEDYKRMLHE